MSGNFSNTPAQKYSNFQYGTQQRYQSNPVDHQNQRPYEPGQSFRNEQIKGLYPDKSFKNTISKSQGSSFPSGNWQTSYQCNVMRQCESKSETCSEQLPHCWKEQPMQAPAASNSQVSTVANFTHFSNPVSSQQSNFPVQTPPFYHSSNLQQPHNTSGSNRMCSPLPNQQVQNQGPGKVSQFLASNRFPTNLQYQTNHSPVSHMSHQTNTSSHFSNSPSNHQGNCAKQTQLNHQFSSSSYLTSSSKEQSFISSSQCSSITNQHTRQQQYPPRPNQAPQFPVYNKMPPNIPYQPDGRSASVSQNSVGRLNTTPSHHENAVLQQKTQLHQQSFVTNQPTKFPSSQQNTSLHQIQNCQPNVFSNQTGSFLQPNSIPSGSTTVTTVCNQQSSGSSDLQNQTPQIPVNSPSSNLQNSSYHSQVLQPSSQVLIPVSVPGLQPNLNTGASLFVPKPVSSQHHFSNYQAPGNTPDMRKTQQENTNSQLVQYRQPNPSNTQIGSAQQLGSVPPVPNSMPFIGNQRSVGQQNIQVPPSPVSNLPSNSQNNLYQQPAVTPSSQISVPLPIAASQPNVNTPCTMPLGPPSNIPFPPVPMQQYFGTYQTLGSALETNISAAEKSQSERDSEWVSQWLVAREKGKKSSEVKKPSVSIPEIRKLLHQATTFLKALSLIRDSMKSCKNDDDEAWENKTKQALNIKQRLQGLLERLLQPEVVLQLMIKLKRRKKKRELHRKQRERRKMEKLEQQKRRLETHRNLDSYMETEKEKVLQAKREEELKKEADVILSEVRRKLQEGKRAQERLRVIEKLRQARKETAEKRGLHISEETDKWFIEKITQMREMVHKQLTHYDAEEKALKVMLETEQEGQLEQEETNRKERQKKLLDKMQEEIKQCLFGDNDPLDASDPLWYFRQYYTQAESGLEALLQTRRQWDMYLVPPTNPAGSSVPVCWVTPDPPSSHSWASALSLKECE